MQVNSITLRDLTYERLAGGLGDLLLAVFDAGVSYGMGIPADGPANPTLDALLETTRARWHAETAAARSMRGDPDAAPAWLREQQALVEAAIGGRR
jgi:hypothetical protein